MSLIGILVALIVVGVLLWGINAILGVVPIPEPFKTIIWVIVVIIALRTTRRAWTLVRLKATPRRDQAEDSKAESNTRSTTGEMDSIISAATVCSNHRG